MRLSTRTFGPVKSLKLQMFAGLLSIGTLGCVDNVDPYSPEEPFPQSLHSLAPPVFEGESRVVAGETAVELDTQPLEFNHAIHAGAVGEGGEGGLGMDCQFCHSGARRSESAGVPPTQVCWNCHVAIDPAGRPALATLEQYCDAPEGSRTCEGDEPIPWVKVHDLPDFVHFDHSAHVRANENNTDQRVECSECHGAMEEQGVANRESSLLMGWCLDCHENHPSVNENHGAQAELRRAELKDCYTCHK